MFDAAEVVSPLGNGALPPECDTLLQELVIDDYTYVGQAAAYAGTKTGLPVAAVTSRMVAEHALRYDTSELAVSAGSPAGPAAASAVTIQSGKDLLRSASLREGMDASPIATTPWIQPWVPMFLEWTLALRADETLTGWTLADTDVNPAAGTSGDPGNAGQALEYSGRTLLTSVAARTFAAQVQAFISDEYARGQAAAVLQPDEETFPRRRRGHRRQPGRAQRDTRRLCTRSYWAWRGPTATARIAVPTARRSFPPRSRRPCWSGAVPRGLPGSGSSTRSAASSTYPIFG